MSLSSARDRCDVGLLPVLLVLATAFAWLVTGNIGVALVPMLLVAASWSVLRMPIRWPVAALVFVALLVENPQARPMEDRWRSPFYLVGDLFYTNLNVLTGLEALRFSLFEVLLVVLASTLAIRRIGGVGADGVARLSAGGRALIGMLGLSLATVLFLEAWGLARGGDLRQSLWQGRQLVWLPVLCWLCIHAFRRREDVPLVVGVLLITGILRAFTGYYYYALCRMEGHVPSYVTTHADSVLWTMGVLICLCALVERPNGRTGILCLTYLPIAGLALVLNDRRLAFVCLFIAAVVLLFVVRREVWLRLRHVAIAASPVIIIYVAIGWHVEHRVFKPVNTVRSVLDDSDTSNHSRDVENFNLIYSALERPLFGSGLGHPYSEHIYTYRIDHVFEQYNFMPHNSVLWLLAVGGILGFVGLWGFLPLVVWISARAYKKASRLSERIAALGGVAVVVSYMIQAWGDMGVHSWMVVIILAAYVGLVGNLERHTRSWRLDDERRRYPVIDDSNQDGTSPLESHGGSKCW